MHTPTHKRQTKTVLKNAAEEYNPMQTVKTGDMSANPHKSGYLFERKYGRVYQSWSRKYYSIFDGELICTTRNPKVNILVINTFRNFFFLKKVILL